MKKIILLAGAALAVVLAVVAFNSRESALADDTADIEAPGADTEESAAVETAPPAQTSDAETEPAGDYAFPVGDMVLGETTAPVTVIEYSSFTCPHCANYAAEVYPDIKAEFIDTGDVHYIKREVYFDQGGLWAGVVARCGGEMRYFAAADTLFRKQEDWAKAANAEELVDNLKTVGATIGLSGEQVEACFADQEAIKALVMSYQKNAEADEITSTPSFMINGEKLEGGYPALKSAIAEATE